MDNFSIKFEHENGLWFATSAELNCFIALPSLDEIFAEMPAIIKWVEERESTQTANKGTV